MSRSQRLVLAFMAFAWLAVVVSVTFAPEVFDQATRLPAQFKWPFVAAISALIVVVCIGTIRRWRWVFWLMLVANMFGILRVPSAGLELAGVVSAPGPSWYVVLQACIGAAQFAIGLVMVSDYRRAGVWGIIARAA
jgi:uncharacterized membrane protein